MPKFKCLPKEINGFTIVTDLGFILSNNKKYSYRACVAICKKCFKFFQSTPSDLKRIDSCLCNRILPHLKNLFRLRNIFKDMIKRCSNANHERYHRYGGRGIRVCNEWENSTNSFLQWAVDNGYQDNLSIDRIDNDKGYYPDNCRWVASDIQVQNSSKAKLNINEVKEIRSIYPSLSYSELANKFSVNKSTIANVVLHKTWKNIIQGD